MNDMEKRKRIGSEQIHTQLTNLIEILNHRMTKMESNVNNLTRDVLWVKRIGYYMAGIVTAIGFKLII